MWSMIYEILTFLLTHRALVKPILNRTRSFNRNWLFSTEMVKSRWENGHCPSLLPSGKAVCASGKPHCMREVNPDRGWYHGPLRLLPALGLWELSVLQDVWLSSVYCQDLISGASQRVLAGSHTKPHIMHAASRHILYGVPWALQQCWWETKFGVVWRDMNKHP